MRQLRISDISLLICVPVCMIALSAYAAGGDPPNPAAKQADSQLAGNDAGNQSAVGHGKKGRKWSSDTRRRGRWGPGPMLWMRMSDQEKAELKQFMATNFPDRFDSLLALESTDPDRFEQRMGRIVPEMMKLHALAERDSELFQLRKAIHTVEFDLRRLLREYAFADSDADKQKLLTQIRPLVEQRFDLMQKMLGGEVARLEQKLDRMRAHLADKAKNRDAEVQKDLQELLDKGFSRHRGPHDAEDDFGPPDEPPPGENPPAED